MQNFHTLNGSGAGGICLSYILVSSVFSEKDLLIFFAIQMYIMSTIVVVVVYYNVSRFNVCVWLLLLYYSRKRYIEGIL